VPLLAPSASPTPVPVPFLTRCMLVYELMEGGDLEHLLFTTEGPGLAWEVRAAPQLCSPAARVLILRRMNSYQAHASAGARGRCCLC
jgi:hypothetical protein